MAIPFMPHRLIEVFHRLPLAPDPLGVPANDDPALMSLEDAPRVDFLEAFRYWHRTAKPAAASAADRELWPRLGHGGSS